MSALTVNPARWWRQDGDAVVCELCPHACRLTTGEVGRCGVRSNEAGELVTQVYGRVAVGRAAAIERKFLHHVAPGALAYSYAAPGCNLRCRFCQNWMVSQVPRSGLADLPTRELTPAALVAEAVTAGCRVVAGTYTEPGLAFEYALELAQLARESGLLVVWKTNGYLSPGPQWEISPYLEAVNVDLKSLSDQTCYEVVGCEPGHVLEAIRRYHAAGVWVELTTPLIPTINDGEAETGAMIQFIFDRLGPDTPWHLTRFHPDHALRHLPPTPTDALYELRDRALAAGLRYVYTDAEGSGVGWQTSCPGCGRVVIERSEYCLVADHLRDGCCPDCGTSIPGRGL